MQNAQERLQAWIQDVPVRILAFSDEQLSAKPQPGKWSKKEILGHLCDSALTNLQRFVRAQYESQPYIVLKYDQDNWAALMDYQNQPSSQIVELWVSLNRQAAAVMARMPQEARQRACQADEQSIVTLEWLMEDYVDHLEHHLEQIFS